MLSSVFLLFYAVTFLRKCYISMHTCEITTSFVQLLLLCHLTTEITRNSVGRCMVMAHVDVLKIVVDYPAPI